MGNVLSTAKGPSASGDDRLDFLPFLDLPSELRVFVYDHLFAMLRTDLRKCVLTSTGLNKAEAFPGLTRACALVRNEAAPHYEQYLRSVHAVCS